MSLADFHRLDGFLKRFPPVDILVASYLHYKEPGQEERVTPREAVKMNTEALAQLPPRRNVKTIAQMPSAARTPEMLKIIDELRAQCQTS